MSLDELAREGARRMLAAALEAEVDVYLVAFAELVDERGHRLVRRNGHAPARQLATGAGQVEVVRPRVDDRRVDPTAASASRSTASSCPMVPPLAQGGPGAGAAVPARAQLQRLRPRVGGAVRLGGGPVGLGHHPARWPVAGRTRGFAQRDLSEVDAVSCWADGVHGSIRLGDQGRRCWLVIVGVRADGTKEPVAWPLAPASRPTTGPSC
jgi:putative transposase